MADQGAGIDEVQIRVQLAAAFPLTVHEGWHESVANHFSAAVSDDSVMDGSGAPDPSAWAIHGQIHEASLRARVLHHLHPPYAKAVASLDRAEPDYRE